MTAPTLLDYADAAFTVGSPKTTDDLNWNGNGDLVVVLGMTEDNGVPWSTTPAVTGVTLAALSGLPTNTPNSCKGGGWSGTATGDGNGTVSVSLSASGANTLAAWTFSGHGGVVNPTPVVSTALTVSLNVAGPDSTVVMILGDWNASPDVTVDTVPAGGTVRRAQQASGAATCLIVQWTGQAAGTRNYGVSNWTSTGTITKVIAEIKGTAGGGTSPVSSDHDFRWRVATQVQSDHDLRWRVSTVVQSDHDFRWRAATRVQSDHEFLWRVSTPVTSDHDFRWRTAVLVASTHDFRWRVATRVTSDHDLRWLSRTTVVSDHDFRWRVGSTVTSDHDFRWVVAGVGTTPVTSDHDFRWRSLTRVTSDHSFPWRVATRVQSDHDLRWRVWTGVVSDHDLRWRVFTPVESTSEFRWLVFTRVQADHTFRWVVSSDVVIVPDVVVSLASPVSTFSLGSPTSVITLADEIREVTM